MVGLSLISFSDGTIGFLLINLNNFYLAFHHLSGIYLEILLFSDKLLKKYLTILSSKE